MKTSKGFIAPLLLALIAILLIGGGAYAYVQKKQVSQSVVSTSDWKTYTNTQYGFAFQYPQTLALKSEGETIPGVSQHQWWVRFQNSNGKEFEVDITENKPVDINVQLVATKFTGNVKTQPVMIGEKSGIRFDTTDEAGSVITIRTSIGKHELQIAFDASYGDSLIGNILSTFKFNP